MGLGCPENGIIFGTAMAEKRLENDKMRYSVAYPTGAERIEKAGGEGQEVEMFW